jgi:NCAIR mutase (PurE)-related protein
MKPADIRRLLEQVASGTVGVSAAEMALSDAGVDNLGFARIDTDRERRTGLAEVVFASGKSDEQLTAIVERCLEAHGRVLATRVGPERGHPLAERFPVLAYNAIGRTLATPAPAPVPDSRVAVVCAGTSDLPVSEEAAAVLEHLGHETDRITDVGVAGIHRLYAVLDRIRKARAVIVAAGMEGALPSVVAGLVDRPVIAVPTSVGYGASFGGIAALLGMLNSCSPGIGVVNIDNGFGAATLAHRIAGSPRSES